MGDTVWASDHNSILFNITCQFKKEEVNQQDLTFTKQITD